MKVIILLTLCLFFSACSKKYQQELLLERQKKSVIHTQEYWKTYRGKSLEERIFPAPKEVIRYLKRANQIDDLPQLPRTVTLTDKEKSFFKQIINEMPSDLRNFTDRHLKGVFIVEELGGSAMTEGIFSQKETSFVTFDRKVFNKTANEWCTWKENSVFKEGETKIKCVLRKDKENNEKGAFQFIFMHELAHVINRGFKGYLTFWEDKTPNDFKEYPFMEIAWDVDKKDKNKIIRKNFEDKLSKVWFYAPKEERLENSSILDYYQMVNKTKIPSLYGAINVWDDFAESFAIYHHTQLLKKPYQIHVEHKGKKYQFKSCIQKKTCPKKTKLLKALFSGKLK